MGEMKFSKLVNVHINSAPVEEPLGKVVKSFEANEGYTCTIEPKDMKAFRKIIGFPAKPIRHKKLNRKSFKKVLMAWGMPRNAAEKACNYVANSPFWGCGYDYYAERSFGYIWR